MRLANAVATTREVQRRRAVRRALAPKPIPTGTLNFVFDATNPEAVRWAQTRSATLITEVGAGTKRGVRQLVGDMFNEGIAPAKAARQVRNLVPLHSLQRRAVRNLERQLRNPDNFGKRITRFAPRDGVRELPGFRVRIPKNGLTEAALQRRLAEYTRMQHNWRARNIARTESIRAANEGQRQLWLQARERGEISADSEREWSAATGDNRTCPICEGLDGSTATLEGTFPGGFDGPPAHQMCRCSTSLVRKGEGRGAAPSFGDAELWRDTADKLAADLASGALREVGANQFGRDIGGWTAGSSSINGQRLQTLANRVRNKNFTLWTGTSSDVITGVAIEAGETAARWQYNEMQRILRRAFPSGKVTVYRGVTGIQASAVEAAGSQKVVLDTGALSSWSLNPQVADDFAGAVGKVLKTEVDIEDVFTSPGMGTMYKVDERRLEQSLSDFFVDRATDLNDWQGELLIHGNRWNVEVIR